MKNRQGITIAALIVAIIGLSIGFAAFSNTLTIRSSATVNPTNTMNVVFSSLNNGVGTTPVAPTLNTSATGFTATSATINGDTLSNLNVSFTAPGQSVTYSTNLYVYNDGNYQAQLTGITFEDADGSEQGDTDPWKHCTAITENVELANQATPSLVASACNGINISVTIGTASNVTPASLDKTLNHQIIDVEGYLNASVTISYDGSYVDGPVSVTFGDIKIGATSAVNPALVVVPQQESQKCTYVDLDSSGNITVGDKVSCPLEAQTDSFYVIEDLGQGSTVKMLAEWNLNVKEQGNDQSVLYPDAPEGYQNENVKGKVYDSDVTTYGAVKFNSVTSEYGYWTIGADHQLNISVYTDNNNGEYPAYVYDGNATLKTFVDTYVRYLNSQISVANASGRLIKYEELTSLGCSYISCSSAPSWVYQTSYWSGSAYGNSEMYKVPSNGFFVDSGAFFTISGVRPVIEIASSAIDPA